MRAGYGILMPVFSLPSRHGIGDFGPDAYRFVDMLADCGARYWQILPLNAGNRQNGYSPYFSASAYAINPLLISMERLRIAGLVLDKEIHDLPALPTETIAYDDVAAVKMPLLYRAASRVGADDGFARFCQSNQHWLDTFALFDVLHGQQGCAWTQWPEQSRDRDAQSLDASVDLHADEIHLRKVIQYLAWTQWQDLRRHCAERGVTVLGDMPIYVALDSADVWSRPELFKLDAQKQPTAVSGVPPDYFSATGQLWNNPVHRWDAHKAEHFAWWVARMGHLFSLYDMVRIDHFRGLVQYWEIPAGEATAINGKWCDVPTDELFDTLMQRLPEFPVVCEDLGIITDDVRAALTKRGFAGMKVLQFAFGDDDETNPYLPQNYEGPCIAYTATHDNVPTLAWVRANWDMPELKRIRRLVDHASTAVETVWDLIAVAMKSKATVAIFPLQDVLALGAEARINDPAQLQGNWRWRWNAASSPAVSALQRLERLARECGRLF